MTVTVTLWGRCCPPQRRLVGGSGAAPARTRARSAASPRAAPMTNKPDDFDCWRMPDDGSREKVVVIKDTKVPSAAMFVIEREDHTLGHMMRTCAAPRAVVVDARACNRVTHVDGQPFPCARCAGSSWRTRMYFSVATESLIHWNRRYKSKCRQE